MHGGGNICVLYICVCVLACICIYAFGGLNRIRILVCGLVLARDLLLPCTPWFAPILTNPLPGIQVPCRIRGRNSNYSTP